MSEAGAGAALTTLEQAALLKERTKAFAIRIVNVVRSLPKADDSRVIGRQLLRSGTSVAANYRAACRARSKAEFAARIGVVVEEADETVFWLEFLIESGILPKPRLAALIEEGNELLAVFAASQRTVKSSN